MPFDWRILVNGYLDEMLYEKGIIHTRRSFPEVKAASLVDAHPCTRRLVGPAHGRAGVVSVGGLGNPVRAGGRDSLQPSCRPAGVEGTALA